MLFILVNCAVETEELQGRLKALRERNTDLERKLSTASNQSQVQEKSTKDSQREVDRLRTENYRLSSKSIEELRQELAELSEKLSRKSKEAEEGQQELAKVRQDLSMAQLYAQQLGGDQASEEALTRMEQLHQEKLHFERRAAEYKDAIEQITTEKQQMASHYQAYVDNVSQQLEVHKTKGALGRGDDADEVTVEAGLTCLPGTSELDRNCGRCEAPLEASPRLVPSRESHRGSPAFYGQCRSGDVA
ncbi:hypothetical protein HPB50_018919 [Hyalomma asiaticum]|uniref:Uncharacterized protein n=1 Tax=Hyalomma asiaticum TaxID=266040 RepID=A0ACB7TIP6_HYAAI|nr:hypothetical protein HPB50_018919 [Hyalomma asiaticum]